MVHQAITLNRPSTDCQFIHNWPEVGYPLANYLPARLNNLINLVPSYRKIQTK